MLIRTESTGMVRRILARVLIVVALYPILLGGVANMPQRYRSVWREMRREHTEAIERDRARRLMLEAGQVPKTSMPNAPIKGTP